MYRINELLKFDRKLYHTNDLAILWGISNKNTLYTTIKRYVEKGILISIYNGLYSTVPIDQLDKVALGQAIIHKPAYLTTESVLFEHGVISQRVYAYTFVSGQSKKITVDGNSYIFRKLDDAYLNNRIGVEDKGDYFVATLERAIADM
ncbi:MAG TPA: hypothetical protein VGF75_01855, partial [Candidatus Saccharimonadales bacterium]